MNSSAFTAPKSRRSSTSVVVSASGMTLPSASMRRLPIKKEPWTRLPPMSPPTRRPMVPKSVMGISPFSNRSPSIRTLETLPAKVRLEPGKLSASAVALRMSSKASGFCWKSSQLRTRVSIWIGMKVGHWICPRVSSFGTISALKLGPGLIVKSPRTVKSFRFPARLKSGTRKAPVSTANSGSLP